MSTTRPALLRPLSLALTPFLAPPTYSEPPPPPSPPLSHHRRERAARALTIANVLQPVETTKALRLARQTLRQNPLNSQEQTFLRSSLQDGIARGIACAAGGAAASYAIFKLVLLVIPLAPSKLLARAAVGVVSFGAAVVELAAFPDLTTVELLIIGEKGGKCARQRIESWNSDLVLLKTIDRQRGEKKEPVDAGIGEPDLISADLVKPDLFDAEMHFR